METLMSKFAPGNRVRAGDDISGVVEEVIFCRSMTEPLILVEWWCDGDIRARRFLERDLSQMEEL